MRRVSQWRPTPNPSPLPSHWPPAQEWVRYIAILILDSLPSYLMQDVLISYGFKASAAYTRSACQSFVRIDRHWLARHVPVWATLCRGTILPIN